MHLLDDAGILAEVRRMNGTVNYPISALTGDNDPKTTVDEANAWTPHTSGAFDLQVFPGGHFFLTDQADQVIKILDRHFQADRTRSMA